MEKQIIKRNYDHEGNLISKECTCCHEIKPVSEFNKHKRHSDGLHSKCKKCRKKYHQENKDRDNERRKKHYQENKDKIKEYNKKRYQENKDYYKEYKRTYNQENKEEIREYSKKHYQENKEHYKKYRQENKEHYKKYRQENKDKMKEYKKEYYQKNKESKKEYDKEYNDKKVQEALQQIKIEVETYPDKYNYIENKDIYGIIYLVHNINSDKYYVGQTTIGFDNRYPSGWLYEHSKKDTVKHDLELYGENSFKYIKIFKVAYSQYELDKLEAYYINYYDSYEKGYNENRGNIFTNRGKEK